MRPVLFVMCFATGVGLMIFSGYLPKSASARNAPGASREAPLVEPPRLPPQPYRRSLPPPETEADETEAPAAVPEDDGPDDPAANDEAPVTDVPSDDDIEAEQNMADALDGLEEDLAAFADEAAMEEDMPPEPVAEAGDDRVVWIGWDEVRLGGGASTGTELTYAWRQISGPVTLQIEQPEHASTTAYGFPIGPDMSWDAMLYEFELTVTDRFERSTRDTVSVIVLTAPELTVTPPADRYFDDRDGYLLGHYESWTINTETSSSVFNVASPVGLKFTEVTGGDYDLVEDRTADPDDDYRYEITVYRRNGESTSWLEFLVDTDEKVPGILQLGVSWDGEWSQRRRPRRG